MKVNLLKLLMICCTLLLGATNTIAQIECECDIEGDPICVELEEGDIVPLPNACWLECLGLENATVVDCENLGEWPEEGGNECECTEEFAPVCITTDDGAFYSFPNACYAECAGFTADQYEACEDPGNEPGNECNCDFEFDPVCVVTDEGDTIPFPNACWAACEGFGEDALVECPDFGGWPVDDCECDPEGEPVCVLTEGDVICPFPNLCYAECAGYTADDVVDCDEWEVEPPVDCECAWEPTPVCVTTDDGVFYSFPNACYAECAGFTADQYGECEDPVDNGCACDAEYNPVCVLVDGEVVVEFPNACWAECEGYTEADFTECEEPEVPDCGCDFEGEEVCVAIEDDVIVVFPNLCWVECLGLTSDDLVDCDDAGNVVEIEIEPIILELFSGELSGGDVGSTEFGEVLEGIIAEKPVLNDKVGIYPNPINGNVLTIALELKEASNTKVTVLSVAGQLLNVTQEQLGKGKQQMEIELNNMTNGIYFAKVETTNGTEILRFIKQ